MFQTKKEEVIKERAKACSGPTPVPTYSEKEHAQQGPCWCGAWHDPEVDNIPDFEF